MNKKRGSFRFIMLLMKLTHKVMYSKCVCRLKPRDNGFKSANRSVISCHRIKSEISAHFTYLSLNSDSYIDNGRSFHEKIYCNLKRNKNNFKVEKDYISKFAQLEEMCVCVCVCVCMDVCLYICTYVRIYACMYVYVQGGSNMTGTDLCVNKSHCAAAVRP